MHADLHASTAEHSTTGALGARILAALEGRPPPGLHVLMGESGPGKLANVLRSLEEGRVRVEQALLRKPR